MTSPFHWMAAGWKIYCVALGIMLAVIYAVVLGANFRRLYIVDLTITLPGLAGLCS